MENKKRGVLLIAMGDKSYGLMAAMLGRSILVTSGFKVPVHLVATPSAMNGLKDWHKSDCFTSIQQVTPEIHTHGNSVRAYGRAKCRMYELSPFEETIYLDVDTLWFPGCDIQHIFNRLAKESGDVTFQNSGTAHVHECANRNEKIEHWVWAKEIVNKFNWHQPYLGRIHSYFCYFRKSDKAKKYFDDALMVHDLAANGSFRFMDWRGNVPDELCFSIALGLSDIGLTSAMHHYKPLYQYEGRFNKDNAALIRDGFYGASLVVEQVGADWNRYWELALSRIFGTHHKYIWLWVDKKHYSRKEKF